MGTEDVVDKALDDAGLARTDLTDNENLVPELLLHTVVCLHSRQPRGNLRDAYRNVHAHTTNEQRQIDDGEREMGWDEKKKKTQTMMPSITHEKPEKKKREREKGRMETRRLTETWRDTTGTPVPREFAHFQKCTI